MRNGTAFRRANSVRLKKGNGCTSWPTPTASDQKASMGSPEARLAPDRQVLLTHAAAMWPTPDASGTERINTSPTSRTEHPTLALAARQWATPTAEPFRTRSGERKDEMGLDRQTKVWATPMASDAERASATFQRGAGNPTLLGMAKAWATPTAQDQSGSGNRSPGYGPTLTDQAVRSGLAWPTPTAHNAKDSGAASELRRKDPQLSVVAMQCSLALGHQDRSALNPSTAPPNMTLTWPNGAPTSPSNLVLNPLFGEALMGWPRGWTACDASVTGLSRWLRLWRFYVSSVA